MTVEIPTKPRVLIADDSRIVRATLIKRIEGLFEFREALDGEEAWETLLIDPTIRVVITDLTMPKLDGYGLLARIRQSKIGRIRNLPVVVVSGSDETEERERAKAAGATDLITKGIGTAQLLSRLDILAKLVNTQREFEQSLESMVRQGTFDNTIELTTPEQLTALAETMLDNAVKYQKNFVMLHVCVGLKHAGLEGYPATPPAFVVDALGHLLQRTIRQTDCVARTGEAEFTLATGTIHSDSARNFAQRICHAVANANLIKDERIAFVASCGMVAWPESDGHAGLSPLLPDLRAIAKRRAGLGMDHALSGVVGREEEDAFKHGSEAPATPGLVQEEVHETPDLTT
ncbi:MAG: response regulator, partial [Burkholderiaceae bacterium]|nr:response regulator [Burkholderiaceae bacterium]